MRARKRSFNGPSRLVFGSPTASTAKSGEIAVIQVVSSLKTDGSSGCKVNLKPGQSSEWCKFETQRDQASRTDFAYHQQHDTGLELRGSDW